MFSAINKCLILLDRSTKIKVIGLFFLILIKASLEGFGVSLILPYVVALENPQVIFSNEIFIEFNRFLSIDTANQLIVILSIVLIIFFLLKNVFSLFVTYSQSKFFFTERSKLGSRLYQLYMDAPLDYHVNHHSSELDRNLRFEIPNAFSFLRSIIEIVANLLLAGAVLVILLLVEWRVVLILIAVVGVLSFVFLSRTSKFNKKFGVEVQEAQLNTGRSIKDGLSSVVEAKMWSAENVFPRRYLEYMMDDARANWRQFTINATPNLFFEFLAISSVSGTIIFLIINRFEVDIILPILAVCGFALIRMLPAISAVIKQYQMAKFLAPSVEILYKEFTTMNNLAKNELSVGAEGENRGDPTRYIDVVDLSFKYGQAIEPTLQNISFSVREGETIGITGPSGSGKTTFVNIVLSLLTPASGAVYWRGINIANNVVDWRENIGYVPQTISLFDTSIKENIAFGLEASEIDDVRIREAVKEAYLESLVQSLPNGVDTLIGENGVKLSGGQRQRLGIARALYKNPTILIFDEATSSLDLEAETSITREIAKMSGRRTIFMITHKVDTLKNCNRIFIIKDGKIQKSGTFIELFPRDSGE